MTKRETKRAKVLREKKKKNHFTKDTADRRRGDENAKALRDQARRGTERFASLARARSRGRRTRCTASSTMSAWHTSFMPLRTFALRFGEGR